MAELATTARPYARAAFETARDEAQFGAWSAFLARAAEVVRDERIAALIGDPRVRLNDLVQLLAELAAVEAVKSKSDAARHLLQLLAENQRLLLLPEIAAQFEARRAEAEQVATIEVRSAQPLSPKQTATLKAALEQRFHCSVVLDSQVDATLLGGAIVRYGDFVVDGSLRGRIERLSVEMSGA